jgi:hypothetical protein
LDAWMLPSNGASCEEEASGCAIGQSFS